MTPHATPSSFSVTLITSLICVTPPNMSYVHSTHHQQTSHGNSCLCLSIRRWSLHDGNKHSFKSRNPLRPFFGSSHPFPDSSKDSSLPISGTTFDGHAPLSTRRSSATAFPLQKPELLLAPMTSDCHFLRFPLLTHDGLH